MEECSNITYRKIHRTSSLNDISRDSSTLFDATMMSLPNTSLNISQTVLDLHEKVKQLSDDLLIAHEEIENLNSENFRLKSDLQKHQKIIETYKIINSTDSMIVTPRSVRRHKQKRNTAATIASHNVQMTSPLAQLRNDNTDTPKTTKFLATTF